MLEACERVSDSPVIVVEDDEQIRDFLRVVLEFEGYCTILCPDTRSAEEILRGEQQVSLMLLDNTLADGESGTVFARRLRATPGLSNKVKSIVFVTADDQLSKEETSVGDGVVKKPFDLDHLLGVVSRFTRGIGEQTKDVASYPSPDLFREEQLFS